MALGELLEVFAFFFRSADVPRLSGGSVHRRSSALVIARLLSFFCLLSSFCSSLVRVALCFQKLEAVERVVASMSDTTSYERVPFSAAARAMPQNIQSYSIDFKLPYG
ncbi:MAG: hypothetical protein ACOC9P_02415 [bacterium]